MVHDRGIGLRGSWWAVAVICVVGVWCLGCGVGLQADGRAGSAGFPHLVAAFTTHFEEKEGNRSSNIGLAVGRIRGTILKPGDEFSFNNTVGERSGDAGFLIAPVLTPAGKRVAVGGGVCQVASTLYNSALLAGLDVTRREPHSSVVAYVAPGRDATVAESKDLRFRNPHEVALLIDGSARNGRLIFRILSPQELGPSVRIETTQEVVRPQEQGLGNTQLPDAVKSCGAAGRNVRVWRITSRAGIQVSRELISEDFYAPGHVIERGR